MKKGNYYSNSGNNYSGDKHHQNNSNTTTQYYSNNSSKQTYGYINSNVYGKNDQGNRNQNFKKNYSDKKFDYQEEDLVEDSFFVEVEDLKKFCKEDPENNIKVVEVPCPINSNLMVIDISMNPKGVDEELVYLQYPEYIKNIRRGNTIVEFWNFDERRNKYVYEYSKMARKGMMKFVDLPYEAVEIKDDHYKSINHMTEQSKRNARRNIMGPVLRAFSSERSIEVFKLIKANGENAQISFLKDCNVWVIASKNVSLLAAERRDLEAYYPISENGDSNRYSFAYVIGHCWFDFLERQSALNKNYVRDLKEYMADKTFVGEYVGNQYYQHLIRYLKHTILFYAIVDNYSEDNSLTVSEAYSAFRKFKMDAVPYEHIGVFKDHRSLCEALDKLYVRIAESSIVDEEEGSVLYLSEIDPSKPKNNSRTIVLCKLKTLEYRVYRKLREKLKNHLLQNNDEKSLDSRRKINQFFEEVRIMLQGYTLPMPMSFYYKVAETAFAFVNKNYKHCYNLHSSYIDFIEVIHSIIDQTVDIKSRMIQGDNIMTYDSLIKNAIQAKKTVEIYIYAPPLLLSDEFWKTLEKKYETEIKNSALSDYLQIKSNVVFYHINMHNFRAINKLEENKFIFTIGFDEVGCKKSIEMLNEKMQSPQFISYNKNTSLTPFLESNEEVRKNIVGSFFENSAKFIDNSKKYLVDKLKSYDGLSKEEDILENLYSVVDDLILKRKNFDDDLIKSELFIFNESEYKTNQSKNFTSNKSEFIDFYENHINPYHMLKESFLKEYQQEKFNYVKEECSKQIEENMTKKARTIVVLIPMTIPGTGKTYFVDQLNEIVKSSKSEIAFDMISNDDIRNTIIKEIMKTKKVDFDTAFNMSGKRAAQTFETELRNKFRNLVTYHNYSLLYLDKNHPPNAISRAFEPIREELKKITNSSEIIVKYVALLPDCQNPINLGDNFRIPFSISYLIQCYVRIRNRKNHPTLNWDNPNLICILGMFINNFVNLSFDEQNLILHYQFSKAIKLPFTEEIPENKLPADLIQAAKDFISYLPSDNSMPLYDQRAKKFESLINKYYQKPEKFKNTKNLVKEIAGPVLSKLFGLTYEDSTQIIQNNKSVNENAINIQEPTVKEKLKDIFGTNTSQKKNATTKPITATNKTVKIIKPPDNFIYLGLLVSNSQLKVYKDIVVPALQKFLTIDEYLKEATILINSLLGSNVPNQSWKCPNADGDKWHVTTLFKGNAIISTVTNHPAYKEFDEGKSVKINVCGLVYLPSKTIFSIIKTDCYVDNEFPHMTTLVNQFKPKESNDVMKAMFSKGAPYESDYLKIISGADEYCQINEIRINGFYTNCYVYKFPTPITLEATMTAFFK